MREEIINVLCEIIYRKPSDISDSARIDELISDSMELIELVAVLSNRYGVRVEPRAMDRIKTVGDLIAYVEENRSDTKPMF